MPLYWAEATGSLAQGHWRGRNTATVVSTFALDAMGENQWEISECETDANGFCAPSAIDVDAQCRWKEQGQDGLAESEIHDHGD